jgi:2-polyprenyl-3-methyl-5-hydroxy-6-metoxy-1,4-benzoquinol methylase
MSLAVRARTPEQMDAADLDPATYARVLADLSRINAVTLAQRATHAFLERALAGRKRLRLLDVGFGHGDMLRSISRWAERRGIDAELVGIDLNPRSAAVAEPATPATAPIDYRTGDYADLAGTGFDVIISSLVAHHMSDGELIAFLRFMEREAHLGWLVSDVRRDRFAHLGYPLLARAMGVHRIVREDGTLSIARGFRAPEWTPLLDAAGVAETARVVRRFPFRLCVERLR